MRIGYELHQMNVKVNRDLVSHIVESSNIEQTTLNHPLTTICESMKSHYDLAIETYINQNKTDAYVVIDFEKDMKIKELSKRFENSVKLLLKARVVKVYEKLQ